MRILAFLACWAMSIGSSPRVLAPSESSTIAVGSLRVPPSPSGIGVSAASSPSLSPSPIAVPPATSSWRSASSMRPRSVVGSTTCSAREPNLISPSRKSSGTCLVSVRAASRAAVSRSGRTSLASIEPEVSVTMITVASSRLAATVRSGRASATSSAANASSASSAGRWRSGLAFATEASRSTLV